ncbi:MAG: hypothetical protein KGQ93_15150 [Cyanobacteria bacterium REEB459]|nr:hypothetical protein [Cyanobacteria bacterium REEB459]
MSQEDPTIVVTPVDATRFVGGAGIVVSQQGQSSGRLWGGAKGHHHHWRRC